MKRVPIRLHTANALQWLGSLYRSAADALKEHVSNAIDEHLKAASAGTAVACCRVELQLERERVVVAYPYGMTREEFTGALQRVADSAKKRLEVGQIGQLGIGMFSFLQIGRKCVFLSRKAGEERTLKVTLREGSDEAEFATARKREGLREPGLRIMIGELKLDPLRPRGPLAPARLQKVLGERFATFLRAGDLEIAIRRKGRRTLVEAPEIDLPRLAGSVSDWPVAGRHELRFSLELYYDPSGQGRVGIRHRGVPVVDDLAALQAYGLEESVLASGEVRGYVDADFLTPLPSRSGFEEDEAWVGLLGELDRLRPTIASELERHRREAETRRRSELERRALELAREILDRDEFQDLELLEGLGRRTPRPRLPPNGFDFVPSSARVDPGGQGVIPLLALVPDVAPDGSRVTFSASDPRSLELASSSLALRAADADGAGVVRCAVRFRALLSVAHPIVLTAACGALRARARIRIAPSLQSRRTIQGKEHQGRGLSFVETPFEGGSTRHSRYRDGTVEVNTLNPHYESEAAASEQARLAYAALMIGKETIAFNDKTGYADESLERLLWYHFTLRASAPKRPGPRRKAGKRRGKRRGGAAGGGKGDGERFRTESRGPRAIRSFTFLFRACIIPT